MDSLGLTDTELIPCEFSGVPANDIHHISARGMGGDPTGRKDSIENLMAVSRHYHERCEGRFRPISKEDQIKTHFAYLRKHGIKFNEKWHDEN